MADQADNPTGGQARRRWAVAWTTLAVNLASFLFLVLVARSARPGVFGALAALAAVTLLFEVPANALQAAAGRTLGGPTDVPSDGSAYRNEWTSWGTAGPLLVDASAFGAAVCAVLLALSPAVESFLHLGSIGGALVLGAYALPVSISIVPKGVLARHGQLSSLAAGLLTGLAVRLVVGLVLVRQGDGTEGALLGMLAGEVVTAVLVLVSLSRLLERAPAAAHAPPPHLLPSPSSGADGASRPSAVPRLRWGDARLPAFAFTGYWVLSAVDVVLARHWLSPTGSGSYAAAATAAQIALIAPGAIAAVTFPRLVGADVPRLVGPDSRPNQRLMFALGSATVALTGFAAAVAVSLLASWTIKELFGPAYAPAGQVVGLLCFSSALLGLVTVLLHYHLYRGARRTAMLCWPGTVLAIAGTGLWHHSMTQIATVMVVATATVCAGMLIIALGHPEGTRQSLVEQANLALLDSDLDLTVVVPYFNPGHLLVPTMERLLQVLDDCGAAYEVIAVSDGSTDGSDAELEAALPGRPGLTKVVLAQNQGKGAALRIGLARGRGRYLGFIDADGDLDPILLDTFQAMVRLYRPDIILGSKRHPLSEVEYPALRRVYSWGYQQVVRLGFRLNIRDTQTGIKLVRRDVLAAVLPRMVEKRFAFDLELFVIARRLGYKRFLEAPIRLRHQFTSTVSWRSVYRSLLDTMAIWYRLRVLHYYDGDQGPATPGGERLRIEPVVLRGGAGTAAGSDPLVTPGTAPATVSLAGPGAPGPAGRRVETGPAPL